MSLDAQAFSPKEFGLALQIDTNIGTKATGGMTRVNVDSVEMPGFNLTQVLDARSGSSGRVADVDDAFISQEGTAKEITFSGVFDAVVAPLLVQNATAVAENSDITTVAATYTPPEMKSGESSAINKTLTICVIAPTTGSTARNVVFPGCTITNLAITGDMSNESGRLRFSATAKTNYKAEFNHANPTIGTAYGNVFYSLADLSGAKTIGGAANTVIQNFTFTIENPSEYIGQSSGNPDVVVRAVPEIVCTMDATVKYDENSAEYINKMNTGGNAATLLCNQAALAHGSTTFGVQADNGRITSVSFNEANAMMMDVSTKFMVSSADELVEIHT